jgi:CubicO group peptidase (beta-lactamase class C family)
MMRLVHKATDTDKLSEVTVPDLDRIIQTAIFEESFSACACIASIGGKIFHRGIYGSPTFPPPQRRLTFDTLFDLGSLTQPLATGVAALVLVGSNRLDPNATLPKALPELKDARFQPITVDMLLDHTSGLPSVRSFHEQVAAEDLKPGKQEKVLGTAKAVPLFKQLVADTLLEHEPGTTVQVSDVGFLTLGWVIEHVSQKPLDVFLEREVFRPLGLADNLFFIRHDDPRVRQRLARRVFAATEDCPWRKKLVSGEVQDSNAWALGGVAGHAGLFGTIDAVWTLTKSLWESARGEGRFFLGGTVRRFWTRSKRLRNTTRALAWDTPSASNVTVGKRFSPASVGHAGLTGGAVWVDLSSDMIGVVLHNSSHRSLEGKQAALEKFYPRLFDFIAKHGESLPPDSDRRSGSAAFYSGPIVGTTVPLANPLRGPHK